MARGREPRAASDLYRQVLHSRGRTRNRTPRRRGGGRARERRGQRMCGIAGMIVREPGPPERVRRQTRAMTAALTHRGPDHGAVWASDDGRVALGYRRLAIIDLSPDG